MAKGVVKKRSFKPVLKKSVGQYIMICPKCKSADVKVDKTNPLEPAEGMSSMYICSNCNHTGFSFPEVSLSQLDGFEREAQREGLIDTHPDRSSKVDTRYGDFQVKIIWKVSGPLILLVGVIFSFQVPVIGAIIVILGLFMVYVTYFKKRKLCDG